MVTTSVVNPINTNVSNRIAARNEDASSARILIMMVSAKAMHANVIARKVFVQTQGTSRTIAVRW